jgi:outer membrane protein OmpA-like peptidoglycan-associated protein
MGVGGRSQSPSPLLDRIVTRVGESGTFFLLLVTVVGCASHGDVRVQVDRLGTAQDQVAELQSRLESLDAEIERSEAALAASREELEAAQAEAALASEQARRAEAATTGDLTAETVFRVDGVGFEPGTSTLTEASRIVLDQLADRLRAENAAYFLEVQSFDGDGSKSSLAAVRVDAVRRYLHDAQGLPLHVFSAVSAGRSPGLADGGVGAAADPLGEMPPVDGEVAILVVRDQPRR